MKKFLLVSLVLFSQISYSADIQTFLKHCGYGVLIGAGAGVLSLAFENRPGDNIGNVAKASSLGLYAGIAYGFYDMKLQQDNYKYYQEYGSVFMISPKFAQHSVEGINIHGTVLKF